MQIEHNGMSNVIPVEQAKTLDGLFKERVQRSPQAVAYRYFDAVSDQWRSHTWEQMNQQIARWQAALTKESLVPGDRVAVMMSCAEICQTSANFMLSGAAHSSAVCAICAEICEACAIDCEKIGDMNQCVEACRDCAETCKQMASMRH
jgi:acyl-coenzyme A synthetase/AMP-(fatty) acid ligase